MRGFNIPPTHHHNTTIPPRLPTERSLNYKAHTCTTGLVVQNASCAISIQNDAIIASDVILAGPVVVHLSSLSDSCTATHKHDPSKLYMNWAAARCHLHGNSVPVTHSAGGVGVMQPLKPLIEGKDDRIAANARKGPK